MAEDGGLWQKQDGKQLNFGFGIYKEVFSMKTIEERAKEYASKKADISLSPVYNDALANLYEEGYIAGATEQNYFDIGVRLKKCDDMTEAEYDREVAFADWYHKNGKGTPTYSDAIEWARKDLLDKVCEWIDKYLHLFVMKGHILYPKLAQEFRKAMEE